MRTSDKLLVAIVVGLLLIAGASLLAANRQDHQDFQADTTPTGVANNYILAIQAGEYERAYGYLSPQLPGYPKE